MQGIKFTILHQPPSHQIPTDVTGLAVQTFRLAPWGKNFSPIIANSLLGHTWRSPRFLGVFAKTEDGKLAGVALASGEVVEGEGSYVTLSSLFVAQDFRRRGIGTRIAESVVSQAQERGAGFVKTVVHRGSALIPMLTKLGFARPADAVGSADHVSMHLNL